MNRCEHPIEFQSDDLTLKGVLHLPDRESAPLVIGSHGLEGTKESAKQRSLSRILPQNGMAFFRFDHRGCGSSQGDFLTQTTLEKRATDFLCALDAVMETKLTGKDLCIFGSSMGGSTCIQAWENILKRDVRLKGAVLCSAPVRSRTIENIPIEPTDTRGALPVSFFRDNLMFDILDKADQLHHVLIFHGDRDDVVPVKNAHDLYGRTQDPKKMIIQKNGDHQMTHRPDQIQFEQEAVRWFSTCFKLE
ncbi:MAG: damage-inducible protein CinA [Desulfobacteraceae bacterium]|nr:MAG: damage-inducible protein CinA [Desulfobacteraceae bacterium]